MTENVEVGGSEWLKKQVDIYATREIPKYKIFAKLIEKIFNLACEQYGIMGIVQTRVKTIPGFAEKSIRKYHKYHDPIHQMTDLCGGRITCQTIEEIQKISQFIEENFIVDEANSVDVSKRLRTEEFGYRAVHYVAQIDPSNEMILDIVNEINDNAKANGTKEKLIDIKKDIGKRKVEIQVMTLLQNAWAGIAHDRLYKNDIEIPRKFKREFARLAALLEDAEDEFNQLQRRLDEFLTNYIAYMSKEKILQELQKWNMVLAYDKKNVGLALKIARLAKTLEDWDIAIDVLEGVDIQHQSSTVLRELGFAKSKKPGANGNTELLQALEKDSNDAKIYCHLGDIYMANNTGEKARDMYEQAFSISPLDPYVLCRYLECEIENEGNIEFIPLMKHNLEGAIQRCKELANMNIYLPYAYYDIGKFSLLLNRPYESLAAFVKAITLSNSISPIDSCLSSLKHLEEPIYQSAIKKKGYGDCTWAVESIKRFLHLAIVAKSINLMDNATYVRDDRMQEKKMVQNELKSVKKDSFMDQEVLTRIEMKLENASDNLKIATKNLTKAKKTYKKQFDRFKALPFAVNELEQLKGQIFIIAGGCYIGDQKDVEKHRQDLYTAFNGFDGTIICGGTRSGISGIFGNIVRRSKDNINAIGYLPSLTSLNVKIHSRYKNFEVKLECIDEGQHMDTIGFTPLEPIQGWIDLINAGRKPSDIIVLGINGGPISGIEYRMALALGATVGIIEASGGAANDLKSDSDWSYSSNLLWLPKDSMALRAFVNPGKSILKKTQVDKYARLAQNNFLKRNRYKNLDPTMVPWDELRDDIKNSKRHQGVYASKILNECGYGIRSGKRVMKDPGFTDEEIEKMAKIEHGRWIIERLKSGWKYGTNRDPERKISPYFIPFNELSDEVKEYDRVIIRRFPKLFKKLGMEIYKL